MIYNYKIRLMLLKINYACYFLFCQVVNTTSKKLSDISMEVSVWDLDGKCPYFKVTEKISVLPKKVLPIVEMKYPKSKTSKPVYFLLLKLFNPLDNAILSRNFYWLYQPGGNYKLLEPYRKKKVPLKIKSEVTIKGSTYHVEMLVENVVKNPSEISSCMNQIIYTHEDNDYDYDSDSGNSVESRISEKDDGGLLRKICGGFLRGNNNLRVVETNGTDEGVAFFLHLSVHAAKKDQEDVKDTRILPVHYSNNYFSLVPGEKMNIHLSFKAPPGVTPSINLHGWNYSDGVSIY